MSEKSERLLKIYSRLKSGPITIEILKHWAKSNNIEISERTFYRDLRDLESSLRANGQQIVVTSGEKNKKVWKLEYLNSEEPLNSFDLNSYILCKNFLPRSVVKSRETSIDKIQNLFYKSYSRSKFENYAGLADIQITASHFHEVSNIESYTKVLEDMLWSVQNHREVEIVKIEHDYTSIAENVVFPITFLPVQVLYHRGVVHVSGFLKNQEKLLIIALEQIRDYKLTNSAFDAFGMIAALKQQLKRRFGITENIDDEIYDIELEFSAATGSFVINQHWHETQEFRRLHNGNYRMIMKCGLSRELAGWIFMWMNNVKVLKPDKLQQLVADKNREIAAMYDGDKPPTSTNSFRPQ